MSDISPCPHRFVRFRELSREAINVDLQMHTTWTDGDGTVRQVLDQARKREVRTVAFTEHVRRATTWFDDFAAEVAETAADYPELTVLAGCEAKVLDTDGGFDASTGILEAAEIVLGSVHRFPDGLGGFLNFRNLEPAAIAWIECELATALVRHAPIHVLSHPGGMYQRQTGKPFPEAFYRRMISASEERGVAVEINASYLVEPEKFLRLLDELNPIVSVGSDVHRLDDMGRCRDLLMDWFGW